jgi:hypothetical protein
MVKRKETIQARMPYKTVDLTSSEDLVKARSKNKPPEAQLGLTMEFCDPEAIVVV